MAKNEVKDPKLKFGGCYNTIQLSKNEGVIFVPQTWFYVKKIYLEGRYNYENHNTFSLYVGKSFKSQNNTDIEFIPMIGGVIGKTNGISPGFNFELSNKSFSTFSQCQYTIDILKKGSYFWDWTGFNFMVNKFTGLGGGVQIYEPIYDKRFFRCGPEIRFSFNKWNFEIYFYNFWNIHPVYSVGIEYNNI